LVTFERELIIEPDQSDDLDMGDDARNADINPTENRFERNFRHAKSAEHAREQRAISVSTRGSVKSVGDSSSYVPPVPSVSTLANDVNVSTDDKLTRSLSSILGELPIYYSK
jgi:hypothetical protein